CWQGQESRHGRGNERSGGRRLGGGRSRRRQRLCRSRLSRCRHDADQSATRSPDRGCHRGTAMAARAIGGYPGLDAGRAGRAASRPVPTVFGRRPGTPGIKDRREPIARTLSATIRDTCMPAFTILTCMHRMHWEAVKMAMLTVRNIPDEVHRALRVRAAQHGHSMEAEVREILESAVAPEGRVKLGTLLADIGRKANLTEEEFAVFE